jgi:glycosyltransferase involved in cell wall biosynthesis
MILYSIVVPVYKNEPNLKELLECVAGLHARLGGGLELVCVVDGSPDRCYPILREALAVQPYPSQLLLHSRNYGSFAAIRTGMEAVKGRYTAVMAADLQEPPELVVGFFEILERDQADVVVGARICREDPWASRVSAGAFWWLYKRLIIPELPEGGVDVFGCNDLFRRQLLALKEAHSSLVGLIYWLGFRRSTVSYRRNARMHGASAWTLRKKVNYLLDSIFAFSDLPIKLLMGLGGMGLVFVAVFGVLILVMKLSGMVPVPGYAATALTILFFGSLNIIGLGIVGSYVWRCFGNTMGRPQGIAMQHHTFSGSGDRA